MTPPPAGSHAEQPSEFSLAPAPSEVLAGALSHLVDGAAWTQLRVVVEVVVLYLSSTAALFAAPVAQSGSGHWLAATFPILTLAVLHARRDPDERLSGSLVDTGTHVLGVVSLSAMLAVAASSILGGAHPVGLALRLWLFSTVYLGVARAVLASIRRQAIQSHALATPTLVVGAGIVGEHLVRRLTADRRYGLRPVGFLDADPLPIPAGGSSVPVIGDLENLADAVRQTGARHVILAFSSEPDHVLVEMVRECQRLGVNVSLVPRLFEAVNERAVLDHIGGVPLLSLHPTDPRSWHFAVKHALDRVAALVALLVLAPLMIAIALAVQASSRGPILFRQRRVGRDGRPFDLLKFRTMREAAVAQPFTPPEGCAPGGVEGEDRRTRVGCLLRECSLDELPQLINVLRGEMSLVGPRPERPEFVERFIAEVDRYQDRHRVKAGITGWAQVHGLRGQTSIGDRVEWDNYYVQNWSLGLDLRIIALTIAEVLRFRG
jgi:exopolysaccharide biosynthesis polyprenyl glycosylphosphotransferase